MKRFFKLLPAALLSASLFATACNDDFLEKAPITTLSEANSFGDYNSFKAYAFSLYSSFNNLTINTNNGSEYADAQFRGDFAAGIMSHRSNTQNQYAFQTVQSATKGNGWDFTDIRRANILLAHVDDGTLTPEEADHWRAVGYFFHSWWYMELIDRFGDVPYIDKVLTDNSPELQMARTPRAEVAAKILERLEWAVEHIGTFNDGENTINADACRAALSRFCLREGTWAKYHNLPNEDANMFFDKCMEHSQALMDVYTTLYKGTAETPAAGYGELWTSEKLTTKQGVILAKEFVKGLNKNRYDDYEHISASFADVPHHTFELFLTKDGKAYEHKDSDIYAVFRDRDPRLYHNIMPPYAVVEVANASPNNVDEFAKWRFLKKDEKVRTGDAEYTVTEEDVAKFRMYIDYVGIDKESKRGQSFEGGTGMKSLPGKNWGAAVTDVSPNLEGYDNGKPYMHTRSGYYFWKNYDTWEDAAGNGDASDCTADKPIFKIEEVLLNYAEAYYERNQTITDEVLGKTINLLRQRAKMPDMKVAEITEDFDKNRDKGNNPWWTGNKTDYAVAPLLWEIRRERIVELFGEGFFFYDVRRWAKAPYYINRQVYGMWLDNTSNTIALGKKYTGQFVDYNELKTNGKAAPKDGTSGHIYLMESPLTVGKGWLDTYYLYQIPTNEIVLNPNLTQNPGYNELFGGPGSAE